MISLRSGLISTGSLVLAATMALSTFKMISLAGGSFATWLRPPYLYLLVNCIIVSIVASSKLHHSKYEEKDKLYVQEEAPSLHGSQDSEKETNKDEDCVKLGDSKNNDKTRDDSTWTGMTEVREDTSSSKETKEETLDATWNAIAEVQEDPSAKPVEGGCVKEDGRSIEGGTLDATWKAITGVREDTSTNPLRKLETWGVESREDTSSENRMKKFETYGGEKVRRKKKKKDNRALKLKKEPSLSQEELNRRAEAFIKRFTEEMRLQRQMSIMNMKKKLEEGFYVR